MMILTIESTCDETAAAVIDGQAQVRGHCIATQEALHERFAGVVPEIAARAHVERILPVIDTALRQAGVKGQSLDAIAVADRPGLAGSLLVGLVAAKTLAVAWRKPLVSVNHLHAHLYACLMSARATADASAEAASARADSARADSARADSAKEISIGDVYPCIGLVVSGGHTSLYRCENPLDLEYLGGTIDDAAGEAFDKVGAMLNLGFPGGPAVSKLAATGDPKAYDFPRSMMHRPDYRFSFSGLKTAVRYSIAPTGAVDFASLEIDEQTKADICASFQAAVVEVLVAKCLRAIREFATPRLIIGGGVAVNPELRRQMKAASDQHGFELFLAAPEFCTDNAAMGAIALEKIRRNEFASLDLDITPGLQRGF
ncbi:MAG: tRNA (adenosine(37)-N6)-threonylcarbamoyltransferase complex transferase subunit TsaD [Planctomycetota bacterium]